MRPLPACCPRAMQVEEFKLMDLDAVAAAISGSADVFKPNVCLVLIDFLARRGMLPPDEAGYARLMAALRVGDPA